MEMVRPGQRRGLITNPSLRSDQKRIEHRANLPLVVSVVVVLQVVVVGRLGVFHHNAWAGGSASDYGVRALPVEEPVAGVGSLAKFGRSICCLGSTRGSAKVVACGNGKKSEGSSALFLGVDACDRAVSGRGVDRRGRRRRGRKDWYHARAILESE